MHLYLSQQGGASVNATGEAVRLAVEGLDTPAGQVVYLAPSEARLLALELIANALALEVKQMTGGQS